MATRFSSESLSIGDLRSTNQSGADTSSIQQKLVDANPDNTEVLPKSPALKIKSNGRIIPWHPSFAQRPDLVECCNYDGTPWDHTSPVKEQKVSINTEIQREPVKNEHTVPVGVVSQKKGVDKSFDMDFSVASGRKDAFPLPKQSASIDMSSIIDACFKANVKK